jgi:arginine-tRNA-protein transferase
VYFYFDPDEGKRSLGTFSVLAELAWWRRQKGRYHYLGLYVEDCRHLVYKARFFPHERRVGGVWTRFPSASQPENSPGNAAPS